MEPRLDFYKASPDAIKAMLAFSAATEKLGIEHSLLELVKLRASQINGCAFCIDMHTRDLRKLGVSDEKLMLLEVWRDAGALFSTHEKAAFAWAETVTRVAETHVPDEAYNAVATEFNDKELADLRPENASLIQKNAELNRVNNELSTQQRFAEQAIRKLQEQIAQAPTSGPGASAPAEGNGNQVAALSSAAGGAINGKITQVSQSAGHTLVEMPLGDRDGIKVNTRFTIYRNNGYVGDAIVQKVFPDTSVAEVTVIKPGDNVKQGDLVTTGAQ